MRNIAIETCHRLLSQMGVSAEDTGGTIAIGGADPVVASPHHLGAAAAAALAAQGAAVAAIWRMRTGRGQDVSVDLRRAVVPGLRTVFHVSQGGKPLRSRDAYGGKHFFRTRDNRQIYLLRASIYVKMLVGLLDLLKCKSDDASVAEAVAQWHSAELEDAIGEHRLVGVIARRREEWLAHPQGQWLAGRPAIAMEKIGESAPEKFGPAPRPLSGVRVLDMTHVLAGPASARTLAEQGADVLHVISPKHVDTADKMVDTSFGKRSAFLDLDQEADRARLAELVRGCDVFVQSWRQGALARRGFGPRDLAKLRPGIVTVSVSAFGAGGPWATRAGYDPVGTVTSGLAVEEGLVRDADAAADRHAQRLPHGLPCRRGRARRSRAPRSRGRQLQCRCLADAVVDAGAGARHARRTAKARASIRPRAAAVRFADRADAARRSDLSRADHRLFRNQTLLGAALRLCRRRQTGVAAAVASARPATEQRP